MWFGCITDRFNTAGLHRILNGFTHSAARACCHILSSYNQSATSTIKKHFKQYTLHQVQKWKVLQQKTVLCKYNHISVFVRMETSKFENRTTERLVLYQWKLLQLTWSQPILQWGYNYTGMNLWVLSSSLLGWEMSGAEVFPPSLI